MFLGGNAYFARFVGRLFNTLGGNAAPAVAVEASRNSIGESSGSSTFDMSKLALASSAFLTDNGADRCTFDMAKLALSSSAFPKITDNNRSVFDMAKLARASSDFVKDGANNHHPFNMSKLALSSSDFSTSCSKDCKKNCATGCGTDLGALGKLERLETAANANDNNAATPIFAGDHADRFWSAAIAVATTPNPMSAPTTERRLAVRLRLVAAMNTPTLLRAGHGTSNSTKARPAPKKLSAAVRKKSSTGQITWPAYKGRSAAQSRLNSGAVSVSAQVAALREAINSTKRPGTNVSDSLRTVSHAA